MTRMASCLAALALLPMLLTGCALGGTEPATPPPLPTPTATPAPAPAPTPEPISTPAPTAQTEADIGDWGSADYREAGYDKAPEYDYLGIGYMLDQNKGVRDVYVPYGGLLSLSSTVLKAQNHGICAAVTFVAADNASGALEQQKAVIEEQLESMGAYREWSDAQTSDGDTVGTCFFYYMYEENGQTSKTISLLYADIKTDAYIVVHFMFFPEQFDQDTAALLAEIEDCYALNLPEDFLDGISGG